MRWWYLIGCNTCYHCATVLPLCHLHFSSSSNGVSPVEHSRNTTRTHFKNKHFYFKITSETRSKYYKLYCCRYPNRFRCASSYGYIVFQPGDLIYTSVAYLSFQESIDLFQHVLLYNQCPGVGRGGGDILSSPSPLCGYFFRCLRCLAPFGRSLSSVKRCLGLLRVFDKALNRKQETYQFEIRFW